MGRSEVRWALAGAGTGEASSEAGRAEVRWSTAGKELEGTGLGEVRLGGLKSWWNRRG